MLEWRPDRRLLHQEDAAMDDAMIETRLENIEQRLGVRTA
jgi:hypothetical protein